MNLNERYRKFPIKFYQNNDGTIYYENQFTNGTVDTIEDAFKEFSRDDFAKDLIYYYDDVIDVRLGNYEPAIKDRKSKGRLYLGKLNLQLDISDVESQSSVKYLSKNKNAIENQKKHIVYMKKLQNRERIKQNIKNSLKKIGKLFMKEHLQEMFSPYKATSQLICAYCGKPILLGNYYENYRNKDYHIECIWDKLINKKEQDSYENAKEFFLSLQKFIGNYPAYGYDVEEDYVSDLELVKHNYRMSKNECLLKLDRVIKEALK